MANGSPCARLRAGQLAAVAALALLAGGCATPFVPPDDADVTAAADRLAAFIAASRWQPAPRWTPLQLIDAAGGDDRSEPRRWQLGAGLDDWSRTTAAETALAKLARGRGSADALILWAGRHSVQANSEADRLAALAAGERPIAPAFLPVSWARRIDWLARWNDGPGSGEAVAEPGRAPLDWNARAAAAEAWCLVLACQGGDVLNPLAPAELLRQRDALPELVRHELWIGMCWSVPPTAVAGLGEALRRGGPATPGSQRDRRAALDACTVHALSRRAADALRRFDPTSWPRPLLEWADGAGAVIEPDPEARRRFGLWIAAAGHPNAAAVLRRQLADHDPHVRNAALESLGVLGGGEAVVTLEQYAARPEPLVRAAAVRGLGRCAPAQVSRYAVDDSAAVRAAVAGSLRGDPDLPAAQAMTRLVADRSAPVAEAAVELLARWPDEWAVPVLAAGVTNGSPTDRARCRRELVRRFGEDVPPLAGTDTAAIRSELAAWADGRGLPLTLAAAESAPAGGTDLQVWAEADRPGGLAHPMTTQSAPSGLVGAESLAATIERLGSGDLESRRSAARALADVGRVRSLTPAEVQAVGDHLAREADPLVWRPVFAAIERDSHPAVSRIVRLAAVHADPDIRQLACHHAAAHPRPEHADWLRRLTRDPHKAVRLAAVEACGYCPGSDWTDGPRGLRGLLMAADRRVVLAAAQALSRHGDAAGRRELARMMWHPDAAVRRQAVSAAAESGDAWFVGPLVRVAQEETDPATRRAALDGLDRLVPPENRPDGLANAATIRAKIAAWIDWQRAHGGPHFGSAPAGDVPRGRSATSVQGPMQGPIDDRDP